MRDWSNTPWRKAQKESKVWREKKAQGHQSEVMEEEPGSPSVKGTAKGKGKEAEGKDGGKESGKEKKEALEEKAKQEAAEKEALAAKARQKTAEKEALAAKAKKEKAEQEAKEAEAKKQAAEREAKEAQEKQEAAEREAAQAAKQAAKPSTKPETNVKVEKEDSDQEIGWYQSQDEARSSRSSLPPFRESQGGLGSLEWRNSMRILHQKLVPELAYSIFMDSICRQASQKAGLEPGSKESNRCFQAKQKKKFQSFEEWIEDLVREADSTEESASEDAGEGERGGAQKRKAKEEVKEEEDENENMQAGRPETEIEDYDGWLPPTFFNEYWQYFGQCNGCWQWLLWPMQWMLAMVICVQKQHFAR
eukprot:s1590_g25.t1